MHTWPKAVRLMERRVFPVPQGRMPVVEQLVGVTAVRVRVAKELEAARLADKKGEPLGNRQERAQQHHQRPRRGGRALAWLMRLTQSAKS